MYHIRLPLHIEGETLNLLTLSAQQEINGEIKELALPLAIKTKGDQTGSYFFISPNWLNLQVFGTYGKSRCTEITSSIDT